MFSDVQGQVAMWWIAKYACRPITHHLINKLVLKLELDNGGGT
jgi:hypothetical protein